MTDFHAPRTPTQRLQDSISMHDMSNAELLRLVRDANHELHIRIDGLTPGGDDAEHRNYHRRAQDREILEAQDMALRNAQLWAGVRIGIGVLAAMAAAGTLYAVYLKVVS